MRGTDLRAATGGEERKMVAVSGQCGDTRVTDATTPRNAHSLQVPTPFAVGGGGCMACERTLYKLLQGEKMQWRVI